MSLPDPPLPPQTPARTIERILFEGFLVALGGAFVLGLGWEIGHMDVGWIAAILIWIAGGPSLELLRIYSIRH